MTAMPQHILVRQQKRRQAFRNRGLCTQCGEERTEDGRALGPDCLAFLRAKRDACKPMSVVQPAANKKPTGSLARIAMR